MAQERERGGDNEKLERSQKRKMEEA